MSKPSAHLAVRKHVATDARERGAKVRPETFETTAFLGRFGLQTASKSRFRVPTELSKELYRLWAKVTFPSLAVVWDSFGADPVAFGALAAALGHHAVRAPQSFAWCGFSGLLPRCLRYDQLPLSQAELVDVEPKRLSEESGTWGTWPK